MNQPPPVVPVHTRRNCYTYKNHTLSYKYVIWWCQLLTFYSIGDCWMNEWVWDIDGKIGLLQWKNKVLEEKPVPLLLCPPPIPCGLIWSLPQLFCKYLVHILLFKEQRSNDSEICMHQWMCYIRRHMRTVKSNIVTKMYYCRTKCTETLHQFQDLLTLEDGTNRLSQNISKELPLYGA